MYKTVILQLKNKLFSDYDLDKENYNNDFNEWDATNYDKYVA